MKRNRNGNRSRRALTWAALATLLCGTVMADDNDHARLNIKPGFVRGDVSRIVYDGVTDDLLTGGLGKSGLQGAAPALSDPPTAAELRRLAIYINYRALVDTTTSGGYGVLYGPNIDADGNDALGEGLVPGKEVLAYASDGKGRENVTMMVQIPDSFDSANPCIVTGASSGSRGVYGAIGTSGEWGLKNGCAVAYTDKGTGNGAHSMARDTVNVIDGRRQSADDAGRDSAFTARISEEKRERFNAARPDRYAYKHAHSRLNPEASWGRDVLRSIEFAFWALNEEFGPKLPGDDDGNGVKTLKVITPENTIVIASSVSNGAGSAILAAEQDEKGLIDGVTVSEPNVNPTFDDRFVIVQAGREPVANHSRSLYDYTTVLNLYQGCANSTLDNAGAPFNLNSPVLSANRCQSLADAGLLSSADPDEAQQKINEAGFLPEQNIVQPSHWFLSVPQAIVVTYASAYARAGVENALCEFTFAASGADGSLIELPLTAENALFGTGNGIPPTGGINVIYDASEGGPKVMRSGISPSTGRADESFDGGVCLRNLITGFDNASGRELRDRDQKWHRKLLEGIEAIRANGDLGGTPSIFVTGRADAIIPPNHGSRAYYGLNQLVEGNRSNLRYYEITNAQHLDVLNGFGGFNERFVPLHRYFVQALDLMFAHLKGELAALPPSQVVDTIPRGAGAPLITSANVPPISDTPAKPILFTGSELQIP